MFGHETENRSATNVILEGGGLSGALFHSIDWSQHPLGSVGKWPAQLLTMINVIFRSKHPMFIWWGPELYQFYNDAYLPSFGVGKHPAAMGQRGADCWPEIWTIIKPQIDLVLNEGGATWHQDQLVPIFRNGQIEEVYWTYGYSPIFGDDAKVAGVLVICSETTKQVLATRSQVKSEERLQIALTSSNIGFWDWNAVTGHTELSDTLMLDWGMNPATFKNTLSECIERIHAGDRARVWKEIEISTLNNQPYDVEYRVVRPSGEVIWVNAKGRLYLYEDGKPHRLIGVAINITDDRIVREQLAESTREARAANDAKSAFLANMSHEIRTPIGAIIGFAQIMQNSQLNPEQTKKYLDTISRNGQALIKIIDDILDLSKIEAGKLDVVVAPILLPELVREVTAIFTDTAAAKGLGLLIDLSQMPDFLVDTEATRIRQILVNLLGNALKFTAKGLVAVSGGFEARGNGDILTFFTVKDSGIGISAEQAGRLFQPFSQAENQSARTYGGTGLGLALSRRLAQALGGDVSLVQSEVGKGCTFRAEFICRKSALNTPLVTASAPAPGSEQPLQGAKILVVDDSPDNRALMELLLEHAGATVLTAESGHVALKLVSEQPVDLVLMDIQMPGMDGYEALQKIRALNYTRPVLALTAHAMKEERLKALDAGFNDHIAKPVDADLLMESISAQLKKSQG